MCTTSYMALQPHPEMGARHRRCRHQHEVEKSNNCRRQGAHLMLLGQKFDLRYLRAYKGHDDMQASLIEKKKHVFEQVVATVNKCFDENFPE
jgi:hypothetical protein